MKKQKPIEVSNVERKVWIKQPGDSVIFELGLGRRIQVSLSKTKRLEVNAMTGLLVVRPRVSNVVTIAHELEDN